LDSHDEWRSAAAIGGGEIDSQNQH
jgi:hypothetical protein